LLELPAHGVYCSGRKQNLGAADLIMGCSIPVPDNDEDYIIDGCVSPVGSGATINVTVRCSPQATGSQNATLVITSNDADELSNNFPISCTGVLTDVIIEDGFEDLP
jgi:hypothetical protein